MGRLDAPKSCNYYWQIMSIMMCLIPLWLYSLMLPTLFALCPGNLNLMFWPVRHPVPMTMVGYRLATNSLDRAPQTNTGVIFRLCRAMPPRFSDNQEITHHLPCSKGGQQGDDLETIRFAVTVHPSIRRVCARHLDCRVVGICDDIFIIARLSTALSFAAEMKKIFKADLDMDLNVPKFNVFFPDTSFSLDTARSALDCC